MFYLISFSAASLLFVFLCERSTKSDPERFLVANRSVKGLLGSMSIAASWIWAPALFVSTQVGFEWGYSGLVWFVVPNILALVLFGPFASKIRTCVPLGYSYISFLREQPKHFYTLQLCVHLTVQVISFTLQVTAGAKLLSLVSGTSYYSIVIFMTATPLIYSLFAGLRSSIITDAIQYLFIIGTITAIYLCVPIPNKLPSLIHSNFSPFESNMLLEFGVASFLALSVGIFADQQQWQRANAMQQKHITKTYLGAGLLHGFVTFSLGSFGVLLSNAHFVSSESKLIAAQYIQMNMPEIFTSLFVFMCLCGLCSTIDSALCAFGSLYSTEISKNSNLITSSRKAMLVLSALGLLIAFANIPIITLWLLIGALRLASFPSIFMSAFPKVFNAKRASQSIILGLVIGGPVFSYASIQGNSLLRTIGMLLCLTISGSWILLGKIDVRRIKKLIFIH